MARCCMQAHIEPFARMTLKQCIGHGVASIYVVYVRQGDISRSAMNNRRSRSSQPYVLLNSFSFREQKHDRNSPACSRVTTRPCAPIASNTLMSMPLRVRHCAIFDTDLKQQPSGLWRRF
jgi:hypothetical protein